MTPSRRATTIQWAQTMLADGCLVLDTETTGLDGAAEPIQIAVLDSAGQVLLDTLVRPEQSIPAGVTAVHGLTDADVLTAPRLPDLWPTLHALLDGRPVLAFNAAFDERMLLQGATRHGLPSLTAHWACLMRAYADFATVRRAPSLAVACRQLGIAAGGAHRALDDARAALALLYVIAATDPALPPPPSPRRAVPARRARRR